MVIDQRNAGSAVTPASPTYFVDRWYASVGDASKLTYQQVADAPAGFKFSTKITVASSATPASYNFIWQPIEGLNIIDLGFGASGAQTVTVGFWIKGSVAGNYSVFLGNNAGRSYLASVPVTTSWVYQTVSIAGDTSGTWATTNAAGMYLGFDLGSDASRYSTAGSWLSSNVYGVTGNLKFISQANGSTLNITGVQLEKGSTATSFDYRPYSTEFNLCLRYFYKSNPTNTAKNGGAWGAVYASGAGHITGALPVPLRTTGTVTFGGTSNTFYMSNVSATSAGTPVNTSATALIVDFEIDSMSASSVGVPIQYNGQMSISAEL
jgi:hypothetical protein